MVNNCLVTKLKGVVQNENLPVLGTFYIEITSNSRSSITTDGGSLTWTIVSGNGCFSNSSYTEDRGTTYDGVSAPYIKVTSGTVKVAIKSRYLITKFYDTPFDTVFSKDDALSLFKTNEMKYFEILNTRLSFTSNDFCTDKNKVSLLGIRCNIRGDISLFSDFQALETIVSSTAGYLQGDASTLPEHLRLLMLGQGSSDYCNLSWSGTKSGVPVTAKLVDFGEDVDAYLINTASLASAAGTLPNDKNIDIKGNRTSASDAAVTTLKGLGYSIKVNDAVL